ncbi:tetratricopeptide repeat protein [Variovorax terrae]|uniref:Tetratricopeptide repeat protein n=1 Tax=Variovorax terrae TaxID=2923278 RepID=A0A9X2AMS4_9BURK|nr:tetratricopeptide repeat protein [Variovorax terrae]MCJ0763669.1 tetratricopeptide repeat protein [Variovorax terrae]
MTDSIGLTVYNPSSLSDADFLRGFVARQGIARELTDHLLKAASGENVVHLLILGQRGMGKTSMLRRLALAVKGDPKLSMTLIPLLFREEQYNVHSFKVFWTNCLDALGDWYDSIGEHNKAERLDREIRSLVDKSDAQALFDKWIASEGRRPLLLLDNIDLLFAGLKREHDYLKPFRPTSEGMVIVGGSATTVDAICDPNGELSKAFRVIQLDKLSKEELIACLRSIAIARGEEGEKVLAVLSTASGRIKTLHDLTGGNPRTLTMLYMLLETDVQGDVFQDLERLLDQATVLYKARVEDLPSQGRVVLDAVALAWDPVLAATVASTTLLDVGTVSSQLDRLQKEGILEKVPVSKTSKTAFQVSERFFNIWYLMRHGARRQRMKLRWLTVFLRSFYSNAQLIERAKDLVNSEGDLAVNLGVETGHLLLALGDAIDDEVWRSVLNSQARDEFQRYAESLGLSLDDIVDPGDVPLPANASEWILHGNLLRQHLKRPTDAEAAFTNAIALEPKNWAAWFNLGTTRLGNLANASGAVEALRVALSLNKKHLPTQYMLGDALYNAGDFEEAKAAYRACLKLDPKFYLAAISLGDIASEEGDVRDAATQYELVSRLAPKRDREALHASGFFVAYILEEFERAEKIYSRLLDIDPTDWVAETNIEVIKALLNTNDSPVSIAESLLKRHMAGGRALILALEALGQSDRASALSQVAKIFAAEDESVFENYRGFVLILFRKAKRDGWADLLLRILDETGAAEKYWPLIAGFDAYAFGSERLLDVNPEVRSSAQKILSLLLAPEAHSSAHTRLAG